MNKFFVSPSPHVHGGDSVKKNMYGVLIALIPAYICSVVYFGIGALIVMLSSLVFCLLFEFLIQKYLMKVEPSIWDGSALITGALLAFNVPSSTPVWIIAIGALVAIGVGKMSFGGLGCNIFNPALVGRVFLLISYPVQMTNWPIPQGFATPYIDASTGATPLGLVKEVVKSGKSLDLITDQLPSIWEMIGGRMGGSMGEVGALALLIGFGYMLIRRIITWHIPVIIFLTMFVFGGIMNFADAGVYPSPFFHIFAGGAVLGAVFMATDYVTSPMTPLGVYIYAIGIGVLTMVIRLYGAYPEGMSFAILIMNAVTPLLNRYCKPKRFA
ncbi:MAG: RnfABCDGE type electron transport complex subunit D [Marinifilaceae bacterium]